MVPTQSNRSEKAVRLAKLNQLRRLGINPYPSVVGPFTPLAEVRALGVGKQLQTVGRITSIRQHGRTAFFDLTAAEAKLQILIRPDELKDNYNLATKFFDVGDYLLVKGETFITQTGEFSLIARELTILAKALLPIPESWKGLTDTELRYRQRVLDFKINPSAREAIRIRTQTIAVIRDFLTRLGFLEVQTPILQSIPGGAAAKPFITHYHILEADFYLRISPELYLKRLIAGGFEQVFEIGPQFRNEGLSHIHNPEFTAVEFYWAYKTYEDLMVTTKALLREVLTKVKQSLTVTYQGREIDFGGQYKIRRFSELIHTETGIDIEQANTFTKLRAAIKKAGLTLSGEPITVWSKLVDELFKKIVRPKIIQPTFVVDYPVALTPLAKTRDDNPQLVQRFQLIVAGGFELVNAYTELNDPLEQERRFREQLKMRAEGWEESQLLDANFIEALKFGMPPAAGWGMGIDRLVMILTDHYSIKEVIPFPTLRPKG